MTDKNSMSSECPFDICGDLIHNDVQLVHTLNRVIGVLSIQIELLGIKIDSKTGQANHGVYGYTRSLNTVESCLEQIDLMIETRERHRRQLAKLDNNLNDYAETLADGLLKSFGE